VAILIASTVAVVWAAGRIFRVGLLMQGKPPNLPELLRWIRQ
jgi:ABC-2 type transport system permease protein